MPKIKTIDRGSGWGGRAYVHPTTGSIVPSVTTILNVLNKPAIPRWATKLAAEYAADNIASLATLDRDDRVALIKSYPWDQRDKAGDHGTSVHEYAENRLTLGLPAEPGNHSERLVEEVLTVLEPDPLFTEETIWNEGSGYAGTFDGIWRIGSQNFMIDWKTGGSRIWPETALQITAYTRGDYIIRPDGEQIELPPIHGAVGIHVPSTGPWSLIPIAITGAEWDAFVAARALCQWKAEREALVLGVSVPYLGADKSSDKENKE